MQVSGAGNTSRALLSVVAAVTAAAISVSVPHCDRMKLSMMLE